MKKILLVLVRFSSLGTRSKVFELLLFFIFCVSLNLSARTIIIRTWVKQF